MKTNYLKILRWFTQKTTYVKISKYKNNYIIYWRFFFTKLYFVKYSDYQYICRFSRYEEDATNYNKLGVAKKMLTYARQHATQLCALKIKIFLINLKLMKL